MGLAELNPPQPDREVAQHPLACRFEEPSQTGFDHPRAYGQRQVRRQRDQKWLSSQHGRELTPLLCAGSSHRPVTRFRVLAVRMIASNDSVHVSRDAPGSRSQAQGREASSPRAS